MAGGAGNGLGVLELMEARDERGVGLGILAFTFMILAFDDAQDAAEGVHELQEAGNDRLVGR
jgi:hypothetical protein